MNETSDTSAPVPDDQPVDCQRVISEDFSKSSVALHNGGSFRLATSA